MVKKLKKASTRKKTTKKTKQKKSDDANDSSSSGILMMAILGIIILVYFGLDINIENSSSTHNPSSSEQEEIATEGENQVIIIDGKWYDSKEYALKVIKAIPQTQRTDQEWDFFNNPDGYNK